MIHFLKEDELYYNDVITGKKTFEVRYNDRDYKVGDYICLNERRINGAYTGRREFFRIEYILDHPQYCKDGYVILAIKSCKEIK